MGKKAYAIHYGLMGSEYRPIELSDITPGHGFICDTDSFYEWGEEATDRTMHVIAKTYLDPHSEIYETADRKTLKEVIADHRIILEEGLRDGQRLIDYVVITDYDDWSENQHIWTLDGAIS